MTSYRFGSKELCKCLLKLGFTEGKYKGSSHLKFSLKSSRTSGIRPFIIVITGRKTYDPHTTNSYIKQIKKLGFSEKQILDNL